MQCPVCSERLREVNKSGLVLNVCADCKGAWVERPELERLLAAGERPNRHEDDLPRAEERRHRERDDHDSDDHYDDSRHGGRQGGRRKREGFLGNLMDMFGD